VDYAILSCVPGHNPERRRAYGVRDAGSAFRAPVRTREPLVAAESQTSERTPNPVTRQSSEPGDTGTKDLKSSRYTARII